MLVVKFFLDFYLLTVYKDSCVYTKLFSQITDSTIWREPDHVRLVWITMLALADKRGEVMASVPGLSDRARVSLDHTVEALKVLASPDEWSRSHEFDGRRIEEIGGGWKLLNYGKYRRIRDDEERKAYMREYMRKRRGKLAVSNVSNVSSSKPPLADMLAQAEAEGEYRIYGKGGSNTHSNLKAQKKSTSPPSHSQDDFDDRDIRKMSEAKKYITDEMKRNGNADSYTEDQWLEAVCERAGVTVKRGLALEKLRKTWPTSAK